MGQMQGEKEQSYDIKTGDVNILKTVNHHGENIIMVERIILQQGELRIEFARSEMQKVKNDESKDDQPAHDHVARGEARLDVIFPFVRDRTGAAILERERDGEENMQQNICQEKAADHPKEQTEIAQMLRVTVHPVGSEKDLQIPEKMSDHKCEQNDPGHRHDHFLADR